MLLAGVSLPAQDAPIRLPDVEARSGVEQRSLRLNVPDAALNDLLTRAFTLHGGLDLSGGRRAEFLVEAQPVSGAATPSVRVVIRSGSQLLDERTLSGRDNLQAALTAADYVVQRLLGRPGFFRGQLAFVSDRSGSDELYLSDLLFERPIQLTQQRASIVGPTLSPDGRTLLYTSYYRGGFPDIYRLDLRSRKVTPFARFRGTNTGAAFAPGGEQVAFVSSGPGNSELFVKHIDGGQLRRLTHTRALETQPTWSPDGQRLAFTSDSRGRPQIYVMPADGSRQRRVPTDISGHCSEPDWNPVEAHLLAFTAAQGGAFEVAVYDFERGRARVVTRTAGDGVHPAWLPDGRHLIYTQRTERFRRLRLLDTWTGRDSVLTSSRFLNASQATFALPRG